MKRKFLIGLCLFSLTMFAAKPVKINFSYTYLSNDRNESQAMAEQHAIERAKQKALEQKFGVNVSSIIVSMENETSENGNLKYDEDFFSLGGSITRGEWLENVSEKVLDSRHNGEYWEVRVYVEGVAREKIGTPIELSYAFINNSHDRDNRAIYYDHDDIFLRFLSPVDGSLCVYLIDEEKNAYCLLPYANSPLGHYNIKANEEYFLFSKQSDPDAEEYTLSTQRAIVNNAIYLIFSPNTFTKAADKKSSLNFRDEPLPRNLPYAAFVRWLSRNQTQDTDMVVKTEVITIKK